MRRAIFRIRQRGRDRIPDGGKALAGGGMRVVRLTTLAESSLLRIP